MSSSKRRTYTPEYRVEAAKLVIDTGRTIAQVAKEIGVSPQLLGRWVTKERASNGSQAKLDVAERAELEQLRKENQQLKVDVEFLGKASAFFASRCQMRTGSN